MINVTIVVEEGNVFMGQFGHWQDAFYYFSPELTDPMERIESIMRFCRDEGWKVQFMFDLASD